MLVLAEGIDAPEWRGTLLRFGGASQVRELGHEARGESWQVRAEVAGREIAFGLTPGAPHRVQNRAGGTGVGPRRRSR